MPRPIERVQTFRAQVELGHKAPAVMVPFDPQKTWGLEPAMTPFFDGELPGWPVQGLLNGTGFKGFIQSRWGRFFILVPDRADTRPGETVQVLVQPA